MQGIRSTNNDSHGTSGTLASRRKLHRGHFAFMRAVVQGLNASEVWDRYLRCDGMHTDLRAVRATITWMRSEFAAAAKREGRPGTSRLIVLEVPAIPSAGQALPDLDEFAAERGLEDFAVAEQLLAYEATFGASLRRIKRRQRLVERQLAALHWLEDLVAEPPRGGDAVIAWFAPALADKLMAAEIFTLAQLAAAANAGGHRWHGRIKGLGTVKANHLLQWLRTHQDTIGIELGAHLVQPQRKLAAGVLANLVPSATDVRPLERFVMPKGLDGHNGRFRGPPEFCVLNASNDYEAVIAWIRSKRSAGGQTRAQSPQNEPQAANGTPSRADPGQTPRTAGARLDADLSHTQRAYRREAERFMLWAILERGKAMSSMTQEDCVAYRDFLANPIPRQRWCGARGVPRWSPGWRPFENALSTGSQLQALNILTSMYTTLVAQGYLVANPWIGMALPRATRRSSAAGRALSEGQWQFLMQRLALEPECSTTTRLRLAMRMLYATGLRSAELVDATTDDLERVELDADAAGGGPLVAWVLHVVGKGQRPREVMVPDDLVHELGAYLQERGLAADPLAPGNAGTHLLGQASDLADRAPALAGQRQTDNRAGITSGTLYEQIKRFFERSAVELLATRPQDAARLAKASTHWLRHTHASHAIARGMPIEIEQANLGHASLATTSIYVTTERRRRLQAMQAFWSRIAATTVSDVQP